MKSRIKIALVILIIVIHVAGVRAMMPFVDALFFMEKQYEHVIPAQKINKQIKIFNGI